PASQVIPSGTLGYDDSVVEFAPLDPSGARRLLSDAHIAVPINVDLAYPAFPTMAYPDPQRIAQSIAADLAKVGIIARLRAVGARRRVCRRDERVVRHGVASALRPCASVDSR